MLKLTLFSLLLTTESKCLQKINCKRKTTGKWLVLSIYTFCCLLFLCVTFCIKKNVLRWCYFKFVSEYNDNENNSSINCIIMCVPQSTALLFHFCCSRNLSSSSKFLLNLMAPIVIWQVSGMFIYAQRSMMRKFSVFEMAVFVVLYKLMIHLGVPRWMEICETCLTSLLVLTLTPGASSNIFSTLGASSNILSPLEPLLTYSHPWRLF